MNSRDIPDPPDLVARRPLGHFRRDIDELFAFAESMGDRGSPTGGQIDTLRLGMARGGDEHLAHRATAAEERQHRYALMVLAWSRLTPEQQAVMQAQRTPVGVSTRVVQVRSGNLVDVDRAGGEVVGSTRRFLGQTLVADEGCVFVAVPVPQYPRREQIAAALGVSVDRVRRAVTAAREVWEEFFADEDGGTRRGKP